MICCLREASLLAWKKKKIAIMNIFQAPAEITTVSAVPHLNLLTPLLLPMTKFSRRPATGLISVAIKGLNLYLLEAVLLRQKLTTAKGLVCKRLNRTLQYLQLLLSETSSRCSSNWGYYLVWHAQPQGTRVGLSHFVEHGFATMVEHVEPSPVAQHIPCFILLFCAGSDFLEIPGYMHHTVAKYEKPKNAL